MFNVFSKAFLDKNKLGNNVSNSSNALSGNNPKGSFMSRVYENAGNENQKTKHMSLKERLASVRNAQNNLAKKKLESEEITKVNDVNDNTEGTAKDKQNNEEKKTLGSEVIVPKFKNYSTIVNERNKEKLIEEEAEKKLKKRKRRKKHEILMERMRQKGQIKEIYSREYNSEENEEGDERKAYNDNVMKKRGPGRPSKNRKEERHKNEEEEEEEEEEEDGGGGEEGEGGETQKENVRNYDSFRSSTNVANNRNSNISNNDDAPVKKKRKRRKKKEMEALRAQGLIGKGPGRPNIYNRDVNEGMSNNTAGGALQEENKIKRRRGRPKLSETVHNNMNDKSKSNNNMKTMDIRRYCSKNDDDDYGDDNNKNTMNGNVLRKGSSNHISREDEKRSEQNERREKVRNLFGIITSAKENENFMKKTPYEISQLERSYKNNIKAGVTCIPLNYQENGGGMSIVIIDIDTEYGPMKNYNGFMTFLILECDSEQFFIETGIENNLIECAKHMQLLISPGDTYTFKNNSQEMAAKMLLIACNKMREPLDLKKHVRDPTVNQEKE